MSSEEIIEGNKLIREFMKHGYMSVRLDYDRSWDDLMPVVEKIESLGFWISISADTVDMGWKHLVDDNGNDLYPSFPDIFFDWNTNYYQSAKATANSKINAVWLAIVEFIKWYNTQNKTK